MLLQALVTQHGLVASTAEQQAATAFNLPSNASVAFGTLDVYTAVFARGDNSSAPLAMLTAELNVMSLLVGAAHFVAASNGSVTDVAGHAVKSLAASIAASNGTVSPDA